MKKILCLLSRLLGGNTFSENILRAVRGLDDVHVDCHSFTHDLYRQFPAPKMLRCSNILEASWVISKSLDTIKLGKYDLVVLGSFEHVWPARKVLGHIPVVLFHDSTPTASLRLSQRKRLSLSSCYKPFMLHPIYRYIYIGLLKKVNLFFPRTPWCADSLSKDFYIDKCRIFPTLTSLDLSKWSPTSSPIYETSLKLLFVGNDFKRKGGLELLKIFDLFGRDDVYLTIISNDDCLGNLEFPPNVRIVQNVHHKNMPAYYRKADVFVFPTFQDQLGLSNAEALSCGIPVVARNVGGIPDIIKDGYNGFVLSYESTPADWAYVLKSLAADSAKLSRMKRNARLSALSMFSEESFDNLVRDNIKKLL